MNEKTWLMIGVGVAVVAGVYFYSKRASAAAPALATSTPYTGPSLQPPKQNVPVPAPAPAPPIPLTGTGPITKIEQVEPVMYSAVKKGWSMGINVWQDTAQTYTLIFAYTSSEPAPEQWKSSIAQKFNVSPTIVSISGA